MAVRRGADADSDAGSDVAEEQLTAGAPLSRRVIATQDALLRGAREVFAARGYEAATIVEIVERSGTSTGSLYNQFGGKAGLFFALRREFSAQLWAVTANAMDALRETGEQDPLTIYLAGARAYLVACWDERDVASLLMSGDVPPGAEAARHERLYSWIKQNAAVLEVDHWRFGEALAAAVTGIVSVAIPQILTCTNRAEAIELIDYYAELITRLMRPSAL